MKNKLLLGFVLLSFFSFGQSATRKNNISIGGGKESYNGDLGNAWFNFKDEWYGFFSGSYSRYINRSFDLTFSATMGDYGHCREADDPAIRSDGTRVLNMLSRLTTGVASARYKFANGYLLREDSKLAPYIYAGAGLNNLTARWWPDHTRVNKGTYGSINAGIGIRYNFTEKFNFTYNAGIGYFLTDNIDNRVEGRNDMYMQSTFSLGMNF